MRISNGIAVTPLPTLRWLGLVGSLVVPGRPELAMAASALGATALVGDRAPLAGSRVRCEFHSNPTT